MSHRGYKVSKWCWKSDADRLAWYMVATNLQFGKSTASIKCNKAKCNKMKYACSLLSIFIMQEKITFLLKGGQNIDIASIFPSIPELPLSIDSRCNLLRKKLVSWEYQRNNILDSVTTSHVTIIRQIG